MFRLIDLQRRDLKDAGEVLRDTSDASFELVGRTPFGDPNRQCLVVVEGCW